MQLPVLQSTMLTALAAAFISNCQSQSYINLESLGINCPKRDRCRDYGNNLTYIERSCECDYICTAYRDCCIDALPNRKWQVSRPPARDDVTCLHYGDYEYAGVFAINRCSSNWRGSKRVRERCVGKDDFSDPLSAAPTTDVVKNKTYRNLACAKCNFANLDTLKTFGLRLKCYGLEELTQEQIMDDLFYDQHRRLWGVNRLNRFGNETEFVGCNIIYDVQGYLNSSVRFCRSNSISTCALDWARPAVARLCSQYMAFVFSNTRAYRNPHCALCNHETLDDVSCEKFDLGRNRGGPERGFSFTDMLDVNQDDGDQVGMKAVTTPGCPSGRKYDPFFKRCRRLVCSLPGEFLIGGRCKKI